MYDVRTIWGQFEDYLGTNYLGLFGDDLETTWVIFGYYLGTIWGKYSKIVRKLPKSSQVVREIVPK